MIKIDLLPQIGELLLEYSRGCAFGTSLEKMKVSSEEIREWMWDLLNNVTIWLAPSVYSALLAGFLCF